MRLYFTSWNIPNLEYSLKHTSNLNYPKIVEFRIRCLEFWLKHGLDAALDYGNISRSTLYSWRRALEQSRKLDYRMGRASLEALDPTSKKPHNYRQIKFNPACSNFIIKLLNKYPFLGRRKIHILLRQYLVSIAKLKLLVSISTIGRFMNHLRNLGRIPANSRVSFYARTNTVILRAKKHITKLRRNGYEPKYPGDLVQIDGIIINAYNKRRYILNCIDYKTGITVSRLLVSSSSANTSTILQGLPKLFGFTIKAIQTDNGSEFMAYFHDKAKELSITHFYNYVRKPKYNGKIERFNRTLQEELLSDPDILLDLCDNPKEAQRKIDSYIHWYNTKRPHQSLNYQTPQQYMLQCA